MSERTATKEGWEIQLKEDETLYGGEIESDDTKTKTSPELADELRFAPLANLKGRTISAPAEALVSHLADAYPRTTNKAARSNKPRKLEPQVHAAIGAFLADLLMAQGNEDGGGWLRLSLNKESFRSPAPVSYRMFGGLRSSWKAAGLIAEHAGYPGRLGFGNPGPVVGRMTRFRVTPKLLKIAEDHGVLVRDVQDHFYIEFEMPPELVQLTKPSGFTRDTAEAQHMRNEIAELNNHFAAHQLEGARHIGWVAKFHGASPDKYMLNRGGRLRARASALAWFPPIGMCGSMRHYTLSRALAFSWRTRYWPVSTLSGLLFRQCCLKSDRAAIRPNRVKPCLPYRAIIVQRFILIARSVRLVADAAAHKDWR
jgi:hypothetical protein